MRNKYTMPLVLSIIAVVFELYFLYSAIFSAKEILIAVAAFSLIIVSLVHGYVLRCWEFCREMNKAYMRYLAFMAMNAEEVEENENEQG